MTIKVMLKSNIPNLGTIGTIKEVAAGFARNYLLPKKLVVEINKKNISNIKKSIEQTKQHEIKLINIAKKLATKIEQLKLCTQIKIGNNNKTFGLITNSKIANLLYSNGFKIDKHKIILHTNINKVGKYIINVKLHPQVIAKINLLVTNKK
jgi:large subunit ribosomal protein L9